MDSKEQTQNETLLFLSTEISRVKGAEDMLQLISTTLKECISFDDSFILRYDKKNRTAKPFIYYVKPERLNLIDLRQHLEKEYPIDDDTLDNAHSPVVVKIDALLAETNQDISFIYRSGIKKFATIKLVERNRLVGFLVLLSELDDSFPESAIEILQKVSFQIAIATANIIANQEIELRQAEKEMLLSLSNEIAAVKNRKELFELANTKIKKLFLIEEFALTQIDEGGETYSAFLIDIGKLKTSHPNFEGIVKTKYAVTDPFFTAVISSVEPIIFQIDELLKNPDMPPYVAYWKSVGVRESLFITLRAGGRIVGTAGFHIDGNSIIHEKLSLLKGVCAQLGVAMSNILSHEQIREREEEKSRLLEFSNAIASGLLAFNNASDSLKKRQGFSKTLKYQLRTLFNIDDYIIHELNKDKTKFRPLLYDPDSGYAKHPDFLKTLLVFTKISDAGFDKILLTEDPLEFSLEDPENPSIYENVNETFAFKTAVGMPIYLGGEIIAILMFTLVRSDNFVHQKQPFKDICSQLAVAVSNIIANEKVKRRDEEKTFLLSLSAEIAAIKTREDLLSVVNTKIKKMLSVEEFGIAQVDDGGQTYSAFVLDFSEKTRETPGFHYATSNKFSTSDPIFTKLKKSHSPVLFEVDEVIQQPGMPHYVQFWKAAGHKFYLTIPFHVGGTIIGFLNVNFDNRESAMDKHSLLSGICSHVGVAVSNILANEKLLARDQEKNDMLALSNEIAALKTREDLFHVVNSKIKAMLSVEEFGIAQVDEGGETYSAFVLDFSEKTRETPGFHYATSNKFSTKDPIFSKLKMSYGPVLFEVAEVVQQPDMPHYVQFWKEAGHKYYLSVPLRVGGIMIGFLPIHFGSVEAAMKKHSLLSVVCSHVGVAMSNILANEEILARDHEKNLLLSLSNEIAKLKTREDLLYVVNTKIKTLISIEEFGIAQIDEGGETYSAFVLDYSEKTRETPGFHYATSSKFSTNDPIIAKLKVADGPVLFDVAAVAQQPDMPHYVQFWKTAGHKYYLSVPLRVGGIMIGHLPLHFETREAAMKKHSLISGICSQLAVGVSNILANENILARDQEKNLLLSLSNEIAKLKTRKDLLYVVNTKIKTLISIEEFGIAQIDEGGETYSAFVFDHTEETMEKPGFHYATSSKFSTNDPIIAKLKVADGPVLFDVAEVAQQPDMPHYVQFWKAAGHKYYLSVPLRVGGIMIGHLPLLFETKEAAMKKHSLISGICSQLAVGVSNILANEKILARNHEKNLLLSLSNEIATVQSRDDLFKVVNGKIKQLFAIKQFGLSKIDEGGNTFSNFLVDVDEPLRSHPDFAQMIDAKFDAHEATFMEVMNSEGPVLYEVADLITRPNRPRYIDFLEAAGIERVVMAPLRVGGVGIGTAELVLENGAKFNVKSTLLKGVCAQLAVAISNVLASEKIRKSEGEKTKLLEFSNAIASIHDKLGFLKLINAKLKKLFSFSHAMIACINDDNETCITYILEPQGESSSDWDYKEVRIVNVPLKNGVFELVENGFVIIDLDKFTDVGRTPDFIKRNHTLGSVEMLLAPLRDDNKTIGFFMLFATVKNCFDSNQLNILSGVSHQLSIAAANIVANEKIQKQLEEINRYKVRLEEENLYLQQEIETSHNHSDIVGTSAAIKTVFRLVSQVAPSDSTVLLLGETGTGKEIIARAIHNSSPRKKELMIKINCAALPASLIESELFGHERGSFTGAIEKRIGKFELANKSTLFLDEIGEMPLELQVKLLRVIQEKEIERIGGKVTIKTDVRIIAATNRDLEKQVEEGKFRSDLYYRLNIFPIKLPPLRERKEDIPLLAAHFISRFSKKAGKVIKTLNSKAYQELVDYAWPGNIRELEHMIERSVLLTPGDTIKEFHLPTHKQKSDHRPNQEDFKIQPIDEMEKQYILKVLKHVSGRVSGEGGAAELLGIPPSTLSSRMKKLGIRREHQG